jgi:hypothetical protein
MAGIGSRYWLIAACVWLDPPGTSTKTPCGAAGVATLGLGARQLEVPDPAGAVAEETTGAGSGNFAGEEATGLEQARSATGNSTVSSRVVCSTDRVELGEVGD